MIKQVLAAILCVACFAPLILFNYSLEAQPFADRVSQYEGSQVMRRAIESFNLIRTIESKVSLKVYMFGNEYTGSGDYYEKRNRTPLDGAYSPNRYLMALRFYPTSFSGTQNSSTLKIIANGSYIWMHTNLEGEKKSERIDLGKIHEILQKEEKNSSKGSVPFYWDERMSRVNIGNITSTGGIQGTLLQMEKFYDFESALVESEQLELEGLGNIGVWKVSATLKQERLKAMETQFTGRKQIVEQQTRHIPRAVSVYLGKDDFFPYRISYFNRWSENEVNQPIIDIDYPKVRINQGDISTSTFDYQPGDDSVLTIDVTEQYMKNMEL